MIPVTISVGVAPMQPQMADSMALLASADEGLYAAKRDGKNCTRSAPIAAVSSPTNS